MAIKTGMVCADLHFGPTDLNRYMNELEVCLFNRIRHTSINFFVICGDLYDAKEYLSSDVALTVLQFLNKLVMLTKEYNTQIIIIEGTRTHDSLQLRMLEYIYNEMLSMDRVKIIHKVEKDTLCDMKVLYLPEEYIVDQNLYYKDYFDDHYDIIFGHGMIDKVWYGKKSKNTDLRNQTTAPVFPVEQLCELSNYTYFGHIHEHKEYGTNKRFRYIGPMTTWQFDMTGECGYYYIEYDTKNGICVEDYIVNEEAPVFKTVSLDIGEKSLQDCQVMLENVVDRYLQKVDKLRIVGCVDGNNKELQSIRNYLITKIGLYSNMKLLLNISDVDATEEQIQTAQKNEEINSRLFQSQSHAEQIYEYIKTYDDEHIPLEDIKRIIGIKEEN